MKIAEVVCPVALYPASSTSERVSFHTINRATGNRVRREFVDSETGKPVDREDQIKGYAVGKDDYVILESDEIAAAIPESDKTVSVSAFVDLDGLDDVYFDAPYYLAPADRSADETFALLRDGMLAGKVAAVARTVLHRRVRTMLIRARDGGMVATTLQFDYEVRPAKAAFQSISESNLKGEMLELAKHIIKTKMGAFDPSGFDDRYELALSDLVKAKAEGKTIEPPPRAKIGQVVDLLAALRQSASGGKARLPKRASSSRKA